METAAGTEHIKSLDMGRLLCTKDSPLATRGPLRAYISTSGLDADIDVMHGFVSVVTVPL